MDETLKTRVFQAHHELPQDCKYSPATEDELSEFEKVYGDIPSDFRWFLKACGGGVIGSEWVDGIKQLSQTHRKYAGESSQWKLERVFVIGWDGAGNPYGIEDGMGRVLVADHNFGGLHEIAPSFGALLEKGLLGK